MNNNYTKKLLIFDCDGVLFESSEANLAYFNTCLEISGHEKVPDNLKNEVQYMSVKQLIDVFIKDEKKAEEMLHICQNLSYDPYIPKLIPNFNFDEILLPLKEKYYMAVATNRGRSIDSLFKYFDLFRYFEYKTSTLKFKPKPDPEMLLNCIDYFYIDKESALFIGDSDSDFQCSINAGIGFLWFGKNKPTPFAATGHDLYSLLVKS